MWAASSSGWSTSASASRCSWRRVPGGLFRAGDALAVSSRASRGQRARAAGIYQVATFLNWLLPIRGGELAKGLILRRSDGIPMSRSLAAVGMDKSMDLLPALALLALPFISVHLSRALWLLLFAALAVVGVLALILALVVWKRSAPAAADETARGPPTRNARTRRALRRDFRRHAPGACPPTPPHGARPGHRGRGRSDALFCLLAFRAVGEAVRCQSSLYGYTFYNLAFILPTSGSGGSNDSSA
jgi:hypothetical protein